MQVEIIKSQDVFEARLSGKLVFADHAGFRKLVDAVKASGLGHCRFEVSRLEMIDSSGLGMLMIAIEESRKGGFGLSLVGANGPVLKLLQLSKLDQMLKAA